MKKILNIFLWLSFYDMTVPSKNKSTVPVTLTFDLSKSIFSSELSNAPYKCPVLISDSRYLKY